MLLVLHIGLLRVEKTIGMPVGDLFAVSETGEHANGYTELVEARNAVMVDIILIKVDIQDIVRALW